MNKYIYNIALLVLAFVFIPHDANAFTIVIDPGHGGKDYGALGVKAREKDINLSVALLLGDMIKNELNNTKVVYTRNTDKFLSLRERANIANSLCDKFGVHTDTTSGCISLNMVSASV